MKQAIAIIIITVIYAALIINSNVLAGSTQSNVSGSNTAIEGNYTGGSTTYESGSSSSTTTNSTSNSNIKSAPPTSSAPGMGSLNNCALALSAGVQNFSIGVSAGRHFIDETCQVINLSRQLNSLNMKVAAISILCTDKRVFEAMIAANTPCPIEGKIGKEAVKLLEEKYNYELPTYAKYVALKKKEKRKIKIKDISKNEKKK
jgi:hypothetical protein